MVRRNSNQRITKIKRDIDLDLLEQAELIPVEQGVTVMNPGDNLIPYPTINNLRNWVRKYLLKGINGIFISEFNMPERTKYIADSSQLSNSVSVVGREELLASDYLKFTTILDGLVINTQQPKVISHTSPIQSDLLVSKPGLYLSNFKLLTEQPVKTFEYNEEAEAITRTSRMFLEFRSLYSNRVNNIMFTQSKPSISPNVFSWVMVGQLSQWQSSRHQMWSYNWNYVNNHGVKCEYLGYEISPLSDFQAYYNNMYNGQYFMTAGVFPLVYYDKHIIYDDVDRTTVYGYWYNNSPINMFEYYSYPYGSYNYFSCFLEWDNYMKPVSLIDETGTTYCDVTGPTWREG